MVRHGVPEHVPQRQRRGDPDRGTWGCSVVCCARRLSGWLLTEKHLQHVDGHQELWTLAAVLDQENSSSRNREGSVR
jgi:hypothetical protein